MTARAPLVLLVALAGVLATRPARAQLISPGELAAVHAELEGVRNCTQCHTLGRRGVDPAKCLSCHEPLRDRIRRDEGLHANVARACANCHGDHRGRGADIARFDEPRFRHDLTGFRLAGRHADVSCRTCHTPAAITDPEVRRRKAAAGRLADTFLGLPDDCAGCHRDENPHTRSVSTDCASCHSPASWNRVPRFDHASTGFALAGAHVRATCTSCHGPEGRGAARFEGIDATCAGCHADDDPHGRQFTGRACSSCHGPSTWQSVPNFDHGRTAFPLAGAHVRIDCASCHGRGRNERWSGTAASCATCHEDDDPHGGQFGSTSCGSCHGAARWAGAERFRHDRTDFPLTGAHATADCESCHPDDGADVRAFADLPATCQSCHEDAHDGALGDDCQTCHATATWDRLAATFDAERFDHEGQTGFALVGAHAGADCAACHTPGARDGIRVTVLEEGATFPAVAHDACLSCHEDAHLGAFEDAPGGADCASCHGQDAFAPARFDAARHAEETPFALTGAHLAVPCAACHGGDADEPPTFALAQTCRSCHADLNPHGDTFADDAGVTACGDCHSTALWDLAEFDHAGTGFPLDGAHRTAECASCHVPETLPDGRVRQPFRGLDATCASCHETPHRDQFDGRSCASCHDTVRFTVEAFDHERTAFPLAGAHQAVACASCHTPERTPDGSAFVRFRPLPTTCAGCHGS